MDTLEKKHNEPLISVIIPVYNVEKYLERCLNSVINQTYTNLEIVVVDDGSTDSSGSICDRYEKKDPRIKVYHTINKGQSAARNYGLDRINGDYLYYVDSDDWITLNLFEKCIEKINSSKEPLDLIFFDMEFVFNDKNIPIHFNLKPYSDNQYNSYFNEYIMELLAGNNLFTSVSYQLYRLDCIKNIRFLEGRKYEDVEYTFLSLSKAQRYVYLQDFIGYHYNRTNESSTTHTISDNILDLMFGVCRLYDNTNNNRLRQYVGTLALEKYYYLCSSYKQCSKKVLSQLPRYTRKIAKMRHLPEDYKSRIKRILMYLFPMRMFYYTKSRFNRAQK